MSLSSHEPYWDEERDVVRQQLQHMRAALNEAGQDLAWDSNDEADHTYLYVPGRCLVTDGQDGRYLEVLDRRPEFSERGEVRDDQRSSPTLSSWQLPRITGDPGRDVRVAMRIFDQELGPGVVTPEHYVHVANGGGKSCPATEPAETGVREAWPPAQEAGEETDFKLRVAVVDTGWPAGREDPPAAELPLGAALDPLAEYDGHGIFAEAIVKCQAPEAIVRREAFPIAGGAVSEVDLKNALERVLTTGDAPHVINMSAGAFTYNNAPLAAFEDLWTNTLSGMEDTILVAAAGNDSTSDPFYPAASPWAIGVGSLDRNDKISTFSNYGDSADVFVLGRNHINLFPHGRYECQWAPDVGDVREFRTCWARWSGTSFSSPLLAGRIAAEVRRARAGGDNTPVRDLARRYVVANSSWDYTNVYGDYRYIGLATFR